ncbi:hypothetical protein C8A05DRAFT_31334 [Staphylotrichum tortipilum]|uniref:Uncharacterized protein n=1 Tax=Staphylotrichum tortipilum TaxID=2831512 RepID=A0AAN6RWB1_9PEZI|nr:hypothetical protein C8A05DRAFT_31334 [Staphylotrichum longicolle]
MGFNALFVSVIAAAASLKLVAAAATTPSAIAPRDVPKLRWIGKVFPDKPEYTLYATDVDDLWNQVLTINKNLVVTVADPSATMRDYGLKACGSDSTIATGHSMEIERLITRLRQLKGYWTIDASRCHRLGCGPNAGLYWCNDNAWGIMTSTDQLHLRASHIMDGCCRTQAGGFRYGDALSGVEAFPDNHNEAAHSRVAVGWGNCNDHPNAVPIVYKFPGQFGEGACRRS